MLVTMAEILKKAREGGYGVTAPNVQSEDTVRAVIRVAEEMKAPMIIDVNAFIHPDLPWFVHMIRELAGGSFVPIAAWLTTVGILSAGTERKTASGSAPVK